MPVVRWTCPLCDASIEGDEDDVIDSEFPGLIPPCPRAVSEHLEAHGRNEIPLSEKFTRPKHPVTPVRERIAELGVAEVGRMYATALTDQSDDSMWWIVNAVQFGCDENNDELPVELRWDLVMAALEAFPEDNLWLLGDGPFDILVVKPGIRERIYAERNRNPRLQRLFETMRAELPKEGVTDGWWFK